MNEEAIWELAAEGGLAALTIERLATKTGQDPIDLNRLYPDPAYMLITVIDHVHIQAIAMPVPSDSAQDCLTDIIMSHLDVSLSHREAIRCLWDDLFNHPLMLLTLRPYLLKIASRILKESGIAKEDLWMPIKLRAYLSLFLYVLSTWIRDDSPQQEQTLIVLDKGLKLLGDLPW
jgi:hypothetical protein